MSPCRAAFHGLVLVAAGADAALQSFTIVQISDIHMGPTIRQRYLESIVEAVNRLQPDVVAITGDLVDGSVAELAGQVAPLARLTRLRLVTASV